MILSILVDQNVPPEVADFLRRVRPEWKISHTRDFGLSLDNHRIRVRQAAQHG